MLMVGLILMIGSTRASSKQDRFIQLGLVAACQAVDDQVGSPVPASSKTAPV